MEETAGNGKWVWIILAIIVIGGGWWVLSRGTNNDTGPIKIGVIFPLTGDAAQVGEAARNIVEIALEKINADGGINGRDIQLIFEDGKCDGAGATSAAQKLINIDKVQVIIGGFCSGESLAAIPVATQAKVALFSPGSSNPQLTGISPYFARSYPSDSMQGEVLADVATNRGIKKMAVLQEQTDYAVGLYTSFNNAFIAKGGETVKEEFPSTQTDLRTALTKLRSSNPDAVFAILQSPASAERFFKQLRELGWKPKLYVGDVVVGFPDLIAANKDLLEGAIAAEFTPDNNASKFQEILSAYQEKYGEDPPMLAYVPGEYDSLFIIADAIRAVGYDGTKIADWLHKNVKDWPGTAGAVTIGSNGDLVTGFQAEVFSDGKSSPL